MPPKKRTASRASNAEPPSKAQRGNDQGASNTEAGASSTEQQADQIDLTVDDVNDEEKSSESDEDDLTPPEQYICIDRPRWDRKNDLHNRNNDTDDEDEDEDEDDEDDEDNNTSKQKESLWKKPAAEHPEWKWVTMWKTWTILVDNMIQKDYCNPDMFDMYIYNDFYGYGLQEMLENLILDINKDLSKKKPDLKHMWATMAGVLYWQLQMSSEWLFHDDGERSVETMEIVAFMMLSCLNELDRASLLKADSELRDLDLVMMMFIQWLAWTGGTDLKPTMGGGDDDEVDSGAEDENDYSFERTTLAYAKKAGISLEAAPLCNAKKLLEPLGEVGPLEGEAEPDRWDWAKKYKNFVSRHGSGGKIGGKKFDITKFTRQERAEHNFDKKDPLADVSVKDLKEGNIMFGPG